MAVDILSDAGFETLEAGDAAQALEALENSEHKIHVLFTDVRMPGITDWSWRVLPKVSIHSFV